ncbi:hypothetical protein E2C01_008427 [Portunus trituberculatus]|uniref:Uncharacterized protein n=1 Tax=Portunus trituberculatus TaxID=210409 RepID=A0A5B7D2C4_PORTR|nr:hypothetical protein [Portunus trituberculatus]
MGGAVLWDRCVGVDHETMKWRKDVSLPRNELNEAMVEIDLFLLQDQYRISTRKTRLKISSIAFSTQYLEVVEVVTQRANMDSFRLKCDKEPIRGTELRQLCVRNALDGSTERVLDCGRDASSRLLENSFKVSLCPGCNDAKAVWWEDERIKL